MKFIKRKQASLAATLVKRIYTNNKNIIATSKIKYFKLILEILSIPNEKNG
jgi:hypothetical protein